MQRIELFESEKTELLAAPGVWGAELKLEALSGWRQLELFFSLFVPSRNCQEYTWYQDKKFLFLLAVLTLQTFAEGYEAPPGPWKSDAASAGSLLPGTVLPRLAESFNSSLCWCCRV